MAYEWVEETDNGDGGAGSGGGGSDGAPQSGVKYEMTVGTEHVAVIEEILVPEPGYREEDLYQLYADMYAQQGYEIWEFRKIVTTVEQTTYVFTEIPES